MNGTAHQPGPVTLQGKGLAKEARHGWHGIAARACHPAGQVWTRCSGEQASYSCTLPGQTM